MPTATTPPSDREVPSVERARAIERHSVATRIPYGQTRSGTALEALALDGKPGAAKPGLLIAANLEGTRDFDARTALSVAEALASGYGNDEAITALLDRITVYVVAVPNPDRADRQHAEPVSEHSGQGRAYDNDRDGLSGEDPPADVDLDNIIAWMRVPDAEGEYLIDDEDPRVVRKADRDKGERGTHALYVESRDTDGDEQVGEDPLHDTLLERQFPAGWEEHSAHAGNFALEEPEARALVDFVVARPEIALALVYGAHDNLAAKPKSIADDAPAKKRVPASGYRKSDAALITALGERYREITDVESRKSAGWNGTFSRWLYEHRGILTLDAKLWEMPTQAPKKEDKSDEENEVEGDSSTAESEAAETAGEPEADAGLGEKKVADKDADKDKDKDKDKDAKKGGKAQGKGGKKKDEDPELGRLEWVDATGETDRFLPWKSFDHPELGKVEIGGWAPYAHLTPPRGDWDAIAENQLEFVKTLGEDLPQLEVASFEARELSSGLWQLEAHVSNEGRIPASTEAGKRSRSVRPARMALALPDGATRIAGPRQQLVRDLPGLGGRTSATWIVQSASLDGVELVLDSVYTGEVRTAPTLQDDEQ